MPRAADFRNAKGNPKGLFNFKFEFACGNNQGGGGNSAGPTLPVFDTLNKQVRDKVHFAILNGDWLYERSRSRRAPVKTFIMDSTTVVGVGNIYACEALHAARIHPRRPAGRIGRRRYHALATAIRQVLADAIVAGGTTLRDYIGVDGDTGYFQLSLAAYGKAGQPCPRGCGPIRREVIGQRSTFFCPVCQT